MAAAKDYLIDPTSAAAVALDCLVDFVFSLIVCERVLQFPRVVMDLVKESRVMSVGGGTFRREVLVIEGVVMDLWVEMIDVIDD